MPRPKQAPSRAEGAPRWVIVGASSTADILRREVRDGWTGRVRLESGEVVEATFDGERRRCWVDDDGEPIHGVEAVDLTRPAPRQRSGYAHNDQRSTAQVLLRIPRELHAEYAAVAERDDISLQAWLLEAAAWHLRRSRITPKPGPDDLDAGNPFERAR